MDYSVRLAITRLFDEYRTNSPRIVLKTAFVLSVLTATTLCTLNTTIFYDMHWVVRQCDKLLVRKKLEVDDILKSLKREHDDVMEEILQKCAYSPGPSYARTTSYRRALKARREWFKAVVCNMSP